MLGTLALRTWAFGSAIKVPRLLHWIDAATGAQARGTVQRAERRYRAVDPDNRLGAQWEQCLRALEQARSVLTRREQLKPQRLTTDIRDRLLALGRDLQQLWNMPPTSLRDKKELLRTPVEEVSVSVYREQYRALLKLRWRGGLLTEYDVSLPQSRPATVRAYCALRPRSMT